MQVRNRGTIGGSIAHADPAGDVPAAIMALDAEIKIVGPSGERWVKCDDFFLGLLMSVLEADEMVSAIKVPVTGADKTAYLKAAPRSSGFAVVGVAVRLTIDAPGICSRAAVGITGITDKAYRPERLEQMFSGKKLDTEDDRAGRRGSRRATSKSSKTSTARRSTAHISPKCMWSGRSKQRSRAKFPGPEWKDFVGARRAAPSFICAGRR